MMEQEANESKDNKDKVLNSAITQIEKEHGKGSVIRLGSKERQSIPFVPTGALTLDVALGIGGVPKGRIIEIYGPESSGKTTLTLNICAQAQKLGGIVGFIDAEHALDPLYAEKLGVDVQNLYVAQPDFGEQALSILEALVRSKTLDVIVIDSVAALVPKAEIDGNMGDAHMALQARLMSQALRKLTAIINKSGTCVIFINQIRSKVGVIFGSPETTTGGKALKFYSSVRLDIRRIETLKKGEVPIGNHVRVKVVKNKVAPPFRTAEFDIMFDSGISYPATILEAAVTASVIKKSGTWYSYKEERLGQGKENVKETLSKNKDLQEEIEKEILDYYDIKKPKGKGLGKDATKDATKVENKKKQS